MEHQEFKQALLNACTDKKVAIISHKGPDDDSIGSVLGAKHALTQLTNAEITIAYEGDKPRRWENFKGFEQITFVESLQNTVDEADVILFLDASQKSRFSSEELHISKPTFCIDHHACEEPDFDYAIIQPQKTSAAEMVYELFSETIDETFARYILLGIIGDTGNFRYINKEKAGIFSIAEQLVSKGNIDIEQFQKTWGNIQRGEFEVLAHLMGCATIVDDDTWPSYCYATLEETKEYTDEDISGGAHMFVSWIRGIQGVEWGFVLTARNNGETACSFRSAGVNVRNIAEGLGVGGGHDRAAGARFDVPPSKAVEQIQEFLRHNKPEHS